MLARLTSAMTTIMAMATGETQKQRQSDAEATPFLFFPSLNAASFATQLGGARSARAGRRYAWPAERGWFFRKTC